MATIGRLNAILGLNSAGFHSGMRKASTDVRNFRTQMGLGNVPMQNMRANLSSVTTGIMKLTMAVAALTIGWRVTMGVANEFQKAMAQSTAIMGDLSTRMRQDMALAAKEVATTTVFSAAEGARAYFYLASAGMDAQQSIAALPAVARFAQAGMFDLSTATTLAADAQAALGMRSKNAQTNLQQLTRVTDVLSKANTLANANIQQFSEAITNKSGAALRILGKSIEEGVAVLAAFAEQGVKSSEAGTQFAIILRDLQTKAIENAAAFKANKIAVYDANGEMRFMGDIIKDLENRLGSMSDEMKKATLLNLGFTDKSVNALLNLVGMSDRIREFYDELREGGNVTQEIADKQLPNFTKGWEKIKSVFERLAIVIFTPALELLGRIMLAIAPILELVARALEEVANAFGPVLNAFLDFFSFGPKAQEELNAWNREVDEAAPKAANLADQTRELNQVVGDVPETVAAAVTSLHEFRAALAEELAIPSYVDDLFKKMRELEEGDRFKKTLTVETMDPRAKDVSLFLRNQLKDINEEIDQATDAMQKKAGSFWSFWRINPSPGFTKRMNKLLEEQREILKKIRKVEQEKTSTTYTTKDVAGHRAMVEAINEVRSARLLQLETERKMREEEQRRSRGASIVEQFRTPRESYDKRIQDLNDLAKHGAIDWITYRRAIGAAIDEYHRLESELKGTTAYAPDVGSAEYLRELHKWQNATQLPQVKIDMRERFGPAAEMLRPSEGLPPLPEPGEIEMNKPSEADKLFFSAMQRAGETLDKFAPTVNEAEELWRRERAKPSGDPWNNPRSGSEHTFKDAMDQLSEKLDELLGETRSGTDATREVAGGVATAIEKVIPTPMDL